MKSWYGVGEAVLFLFSFWFSAALFGCAFTETGESPSHFRRAIFWFVLANLVAVSTIIALVRFIKDIR